MRDVLLILSQFFVELNMEIVFVLRPSLARRASGIFFRNELCVRRFLG